MRPFFIRFVIVIGDGLCYDALHMFLLFGKEAAHAILNHFPHPAHSVSDLVHGSCPVDHRVYLLQLSVIRRTLLRPQSGSHRHSESSSGQDRGQSPLQRPGAEISPLWRISATGLRLRPVPAGLHPPLHPSHQLAPPPGSGHRQHGRNHSSLCLRTLQQPSRCDFAGCCTGVIAALCVLLLLDSLFSLMGLGRKS